MKHLAIYSLSAQKVEFKKSIEDDAKVSDEVEVGKGDEELGNALLVDYDRARYANECRGRGGDWKIYEGETAFSWDAVTSEVVE